LFHEFVCNSAHVTSSHRKNTSEQHVVVVRSGKEQKLGTSRKNEAVLLIGISSQTLDPAQYLRNGNFYKDGSTKA